MIPALIAVIGPVEPDLLTAWTAHYRSLGIERFHIAFHFTSHVPDGRQEELLETSRALGHGPSHVNTGPWHERIHSDLRDALRHEAGPGWHLIADSDEFHHHTEPIDRVISTAEASGRTVVGGLMLDRVSPDGRLSPWQPHNGLDRAFPLGGHLTHRLLHGDPRKIVLASSQVALAPGNHRAPGHKPAPDSLACVHHFKWRSGVADDLRQRVAKFSSGEWTEDTSAVRTEAGRLLDHIDQHGGRINVADPSLRFRNVTLDRMPDGWAAEAGSIVTRWRPPGLAENQRS
ncbi:glycosyltransferase family 2 protein [Streptomyces sp. NPDC002055]|uniref:glycosyltransferase family 2 protein n=1 Tax=Streptomyces sp. NPDC002055 TaxID=3154534 RepID=UPI003316B2B9